MRRLGRTVTGLIVLAVLVAATITLIRDSNGDFSGDYKLSGLFVHGGEGLPPGSEVVFRGVQVGRVASTALQGDMAKVTVLIQPNFKVPKDATATIQPVNLFGADEVALTTPRHNSDAGPYLAPNGSFAHAENSDELSDLFAAATPLLQQINTRQLSTLLGELSQASQGEGPAIAKSFSTGVQLAGLLNSTLNAQELALHSFAQFAQAVAPDADSLNQVSSEVNAALPSFNNEEADYQRLINSVIPFANSLTSLLTTYQPDIDTILTAGDNVSRVLLAQQDELGQVVRGAYSYFHTIATGAAAQTALPDGSTYAYFNTFILFSDVNALVCGLIAPSTPTPGLSFLGPIQQALAGAGSAFNCTPQMAAFDKAQALTPTPAPSSASASATAAIPPTVTESPTSAARSASTQVYGMVGTPDKSKPSGIASYIASLLGGGGSS